MKIGIPKALYYYYIEDYIRFLKNLGIEIIMFDTDKEIIKLGSDIANDEMCLSMKIFLGHVCKLESYCDYVLIPNLNNYGLKDQMCPNFTSLYNLVDNLFNVNILTFDINYFQNKYDINAFYELGRKLGFTKKHIKKIYKQTMVEYKANLKTNIFNNTNKLNSKNKKVLLVSHCYNMYDKYIGEPIIKYLEKLNCEVIYSDCFDKNITNDLSRYLSKNLYFKNSKESIGSIILCKEQIDGILFLTTFPCGIDSLVTELVLRKIDKPYLNLVIDDLDSMSGIETRIESFVDIIEQD